jgi:hypothetical protein
MTLETQNQIEETVARPNVRRETPADAPAKRIRHAFEQLDGIGRKGEGPQLLAFAIALLIWFALCGCFIWLCIFSS